MEGAKIFSCKKWHLKHKKNTELKDLRKIICLPKSEVSVETISVCNVIENLTEHGRKLAEHGIHCHSCHDPTPMMSKICYCNNYIDVSMMSP